MVCVDFIGRLGNNLFQIAMAVGYADKHGVNCAIPAWEYSGCFKKDFTSQACGEVFYGEKSFCYEDIPFIENVKFFGYFQSEKYFKHSESKIRELFEFNDSIKDPIISKYDSLIKFGSRTCAVHVRRGDYIGNHFHEVCHRQYYLDAIAEINNRTTIDQILVFSDDIAWCKENFNAANILFVEGNSNIEDLYLMSQCSHNIICNSSFSWWGAWLNANKNKIIIAPDKWFGDDSKDAKDVVPKNWIKLKIKS